MIRKKLKNVGFFACFLVLVFCFGFLLQAEPRTTGKTSSKVDIYVAPFSHLDLFWAGTRKDTLARGNKIIATAIQIAE